MDGCNHGTFDWVGCVASSADGSRLVALDANSGGIYTSTNFGATWATNKSFIWPWKSVAASADGSKLAAVWGGTSIYVSTNSGSSWSSNNIPSSDFAAIASSADGTRLVAVSSAANKAIVISTNSGVTWSSNSISQSGTWRSVASSADGNKLVAVASGGGIWTAQRQPAPQLNLSVASMNAEISWTVPSTVFVLQQSTDLVSWANVTNPPVLNLTNLQNQVTLGMSGSSGFYRLKSP
jgi:hypothetical protein